MARADPQRIHEASRAAALSRLETFGQMSPERAERLVMPWEAEAARRGLEPVPSGRKAGEAGRAYWDAASVWLEEQRR